jgi:preprotein translocase subunit SecG
MLALLTSIHLLIAIVLILLVLLQSSQGTDVGSAFGGMGSQAAFGPRGTATFLSKATVVLAAVFMVTAVSLSIMGSRSPIGGDSILSGEENGTAPAPPPPTTTPAAAPAPSVTSSTPPTGPPAIQVQTEGPQNLGPKVSVEKPTQAPTPNSPAATSSGGAGSTPVPSAPAGKPANTGGAAPATSGKP